MGDGGREFQVQGRAYTNANERVACSKNYVTFLNGEGKKEWRRGGQTPGQGKTQLFSESIMSLKFVTNFTNRH